MVLLRRAERGWLHTLTICFYIFLNLLILVAGILLMSMVLVLQRHPKAPGLAILFLGLETIFAGVAGMFEQRRRSFCITYECLCAISAFGSAVLFLFIFSQESKIVDQFESSQFDRVKLTTLFWSAGWAFLFLFVIEAVAMFLAFLLHCYSPLNSYETLDETRQRRAFGFFGLRNDIGIAKERANVKQAKSLASKMNKKYGKWTHEAFG
ncbi:hypothetical protein GOP47_0018761 [Adiantum capillus-veneris]|uniref:Uncharacterized protein n=1 Tax=Adiantum capillus-veneris TaxID=13818 RepID=A0A9D4UEB4_ADICA|nr:hypothetical protein GOP47_0018761 [Adiantum capillus-veneris]